MAPLVSVIIPCYNAERWVRQCICSALSQTYRPLEVIVIDDGSTDASLDIIRSFGCRVRFESGPNRGANHARNRGLDLARGAFIQYLDADDFLLPQKIERQVAEIQAGSADVVYEDWQRLEEYPDGSTCWRAGVSGKHADILEALLGNWGPQTPPVLFNRNVFQMNLRWNETRTSAQDWEMHIRLAMTGARYRYLPGCFSVIRRTPLPSLSTRNPRQTEDNIISILQSTEASLDIAGRLHHRYRHAMAQAYLTLACGANRYYDHDRPRFDVLVQHAERLAPGAIYPFSPLYTLVGKTLGVRNAERLRSFKRRWANSS